MVRERNWLEVYPYTRWGSAHELPVFDLGQRFTPSLLELRSVGVLCTLCTPQTAQRSPAWARALCMLRELQVQQMRSGSVIPAMQRHAEQSVQ